MLQYFVELYGRYDEIPIISMVMYPFETNVPEPILQPESGTGTLISFQHQILRLWLEDAEQCLHRGVISMYTLLPAMKGVTVAMLFQAITGIELQKEIQEVVQRGIQRGIQEERQQAVLDVVEVRFPALLEIAKQNVSLLEDKNELRRLAKLILLAPDEQTARWALNTFAA